MIHKKWYKQTAVYWGSPTPDGSGGETFAAPAEISVRWETYTELLVDTSGSEHVTNAKVWCESDLVENGYLYLGTITSISESLRTYPLSVEGAFPIIKVEEVPSVRNETPTKRYIL